MNYSKSIKVILLLVVFILFWQSFISAKNALLVEGQASIEVFIPSPLTVVVSLYNNWEILITELGFTLSRAALGLAVGVSFAVLVSAVIFLIPELRSYALPISMAINSFPLIGFSPLIILAFGQGSWVGIVFISALISYFPILVSLDKALSMNSKEYLELGKIWGASDIKIFIHIQLPVVVPYVLNSLRLAIPASIVGTTLGEWLGANHGVGKLVIIALYQLNPGLLYSSLFLLLISSLFFVWVSSWVEKRYFPWVVNN